MSVSPPTSNLFLARSVNISLLTAIIFLTACGGGSSESNDPQTGTVNIGISDAPVGALSAVVITVDKITLNGPTEDIVIDNFTSNDLNIVNEEAFTIDLLEVQGLNNKIVIQDLEVPVGTYQNLRIEVLDEDINSSYAEESNTGLFKPIKVPSGELKLGGFTVEAGGVQTIMVEFGLRESMTYNPSPDDRYILKPRGVRVVKVAQAAVVEGSVVTAGFEGHPACAGIAAEAGYTLYLYPGILEPASLADSFDLNAEQMNDPGGKLAPFASTGINADGAFIFPYIPSGEYTIAFSCAGEMDDVDAFDDLAVPLPESQSTSFSLVTGQTISCQVVANQPLVCS